MRLTDLPTKLPKTAYDAAMADFVSVAAMPGVEAVYLAGTVSQPGISDLDFLLVLSDHPANNVRRLEGRLPSSVKQLIGRGTILKVPARYVREVRCIDDLPLTHMYGQVFEFAEYDSPLYETCRVLDWLPERIWTLHRHIHGDFLNAVYGLQLVKSLGVSLRKADVVMGSDRSHDFVEAVRDIRQRWFRDSGAPGKLEELLHDGIERGRVMLDAIVGYLHDQQVLMPPPASICADLQFDIPHGPRFRFGHATAPQTGVLTVPASLAPFWGWQAHCCGGYIPRRLRECFTEAADAVSWDAYMSPDLRTTVTQRITYVTNVAEYLRANNLTGLMKYGWFVR